jgi:phosphoribosylanthranilate isomerase
VHARIKICCIQSVEEAKLAVRAGAHAVGLVSAMPSGPGVIDDETIADLASRLPPPVGSFLLTSETSPAAITDQYRRFRPTALQFVDPMEPSAAARLRERLPAPRFVPVVHVTGPASIEEAEALAPHADALLLDSGTPDAAPDEPRRLGGTGKTHDWAISREIVERVDTPVFLAGGLDPTNVAEAIREVRPFGVDVCSGVRTEGSLDTFKLAAFIQAVHSVGASG